MALQHTKFTAIILMPSQRRVLLGLTVTTLLESMIARTTAAPSSTSMSGMGEVWRRVHPQLRPHLRLTATTTIISSATTPGIHSSTAAEWPRGASMRATQACGLCASMAGTSSSLGIMPAMGEHAALGSRSCLRRLASMTTVEQRISDLRTGEDWERAGCGMGWRARRGAWISSFRGWDGREGGRRRDDARRRASRLLNREMEFLSPCNGSSQLLCIENI